MVTASCCQGPSGYRGVRKYQPRVTTKPKSRVQTADCTSQTLIGLSIAGPSYAGKTMGITHELDSKLRERGYLGFRVETP